MDSNSFALNASRRRSIKGDTAAIGGELSFLHISYEGFERLQEALRLHLYAQARGVSACLPRGVGCVPLDDEASEQWDGYEPAEVPFLVRRKAAVLSIGTARAARMIAKKKERLAAESADGESNGGAGGSAAATTTVAANSDDGVGSGDDASDEQRTNGAFETLSAAGGGPNTANSAAAGGAQQRMRYPLPCSRRADSKGAEHQKARRAAAKAAAAAASPAPVAPSSPPPVRTRLRAATVNRRPEAIFFQEEEEADRRRKLMKEMLMGASSSSAPQRDLDDSHSGDNEDEDFAASPLRLTHQQQQQQHLFGMSTALNSSANSLGPSPPQAATRNSDSVTASSSPRVLPQRRGGPPPPSAALLARLGMSGGTASPTSPRGALKSPFSSPFLSAGGGEEGGEGSGSARASPSPAGAQQQTRKRATFGETTTVSIGDTESGAPQRRGRGADNASFSFLALGDSAASFPSPSSPSSPAVRVYSSHAGGEGGERGSPAAPAALSPRDLRGAYTSSTSQGVLLQNKTVGESAIFSPIGGGCGGGGERDDEDEVIDVGDEDCEDDLLFLATDASLAAARAAIPRLDAIDRATFVFVVSRALYRSRRHIPEGLITLAGCREVAAEAFRSVDHRGLREGTCRWEDLSELLLEETALRYAAVSYRQASAEAYDRFVLKDYPSLPPTAVNAVAVQDSPQHLMVIDHLPRTGTATGRATRLLHGRDAYSAAGAVAEVMGSYLTIHNEVDLSVKKFILRDSTEDIKSVEAALWVGALGRGLATPSLLIFGGDMGIHAFNFGPSAVKARLARTHIFNAATTITCAVLVDGDKLVCGARDGTLACYDLATLFRSGRGDAVGKIIVPDDAARPAVSADLLGPRGRAGAGLLTRAPLVLTSAHHHRGGGSGANGASSSGALFSGAQQDSESANGPTRAGLAGGGGGASIYASAYGNSASREASSDDDGDDGSGAFHDTNSLIGRMRTAKRRSRGASDRSRARRVDLSDGLMGIAAAHEKGQPVTAVVRCGPASIVSGGLDGYVSITHVPSWSVTRRFVAEPAGVRGLAFSATHQALLTWTYDTTVKLWAGLSGTNALLLRDSAGGTPHARAIVGAAVLADVPHAVTMDGDGVVKTWDLRSAVCLHTKRLVERTEFESGGSGAGGGSVAASSSLGPSSASSSAVPLMIGSGANGIAAAATTTMSASSGCCRAVLYQPKYRRVLAVAKNYAHAVAQFVPGASFLTAHARGEPVKLLAVAKATGMIVSATAAETKIWDGARGGLRWSSDSQQQSQQQQLQHLQGNGSGNTNNGSPPRRQQQKLSVGGHSPSPPPSLSPSSTASLPNANGGAAMTFSATLASCASRDKTAMCADDEGNRLAFATSSGTVHEQRLSTGRIVTSRSVFSPKYDKTKPDAEAIAVMGIGYATTGAGAGVGAGAGEGFGAASMAAGSSTAAAAAGGGGVASSAARELVVVCANGTIRYFAEGSESPYPTRVTSIWSEEETKAARRLLEGRGTPRPQQSSSTSNVPLNSPARAVLATIDGGAQSAAQTASAARPLSASASADSPQSQQPPPFSAAGPDPVVLVAFSNAAQCIAIVTQSGRIRIVRAASPTGASTHEFAVPAEVTAVHFFEPYPCLIVGDAAGGLSFFLVRPAVLLAVVECFGTTNGSGNVPLAAGTGGRGGGRRSTQRGSGGFAASSDGSGSESDDYEKARRRGSSGKPTANVRKSIIKGGGTPLSPAKVPANPLLRNGSGAFTLHPTASTDGEGTAADPLAAARFDNLFQWALRIQLDSGHAVALTTDAASGTLYVADHTGLMCAYDAAPFVFAAHLQPLWGRETVDTAREMARLIREATERHFAMGEGGVGMGMGSPSSYASSSSSCSSTDEDAEGSDHGSVSSTVSGPFGRRRRSSNSKLQQNKHRHLSRWWISSEAANPIGHRKSIAPSAGGSGGGAAIRRAASGFFGPSSKSANAGGGSGFATTASSFPLTLTQQLFLAMAVTMRSHFGSIAAEVLVRPKPQDGLGGVPAAAGTGTPQQQHMASPSPFVAPPVIIEPSRVATARERRRSMAAAGVLSPGGGGGLFGGSGGLISPLSSAASRALNVPHAVGGGSGSTDALAPPPSGGALPAITFTSVATPHLNASAFGAADVPNNISSSNVTNALLCGETGGGRQFSVVSWSQQYAGADNVPRPSPAPAAALGRSSAGGGSPLVGGAFGDAGGGLITVSEGCLALVLAIQRAISAVGRGVMSSGKRRYTFTASNSKTKKNRKENLVVVGLRQSDDAAAAGGRDNNYASLASEDSTDGDESDTSEGSTSSDAASSPPLSNVSDAKGAGHVHSEGAANANSDVDAAAPRTTNEPRVGKKKRNKSRHHSSRYAYHRIATRRGGVPLGRLLEMCCRSSPYYNVPVGVGSRRQSSPFPPSSAPAPARIALRSSRGELQPHPPGPAGRSAAVRFFGGGGGKEEAGEGERDGAEGVAVDFAALRRRRQSSTGAVKRSLFALTESPSHELEQQASPPLRSSFSSSSLPSRPPRKAEVKSKRKKNEDEPENEEKEEDGAGEVDPKALVDDSRYANSCLLPFLRRVRHLDHVPKPEEVLKGAVTAELLSFVTSDAAAAVSAGKGSGGGGGGAATQQQSSRGSFGGGTGSGPSNFNAAPRLSLFRATPAGALVGVSGKEAAEMAMLSGGGGGGGGGSGGAAASPTSGTNKKVRIGGLLHGGGGAGPHGASSTSSANQTHSSASAAASGSGHGGAQSLTRLFMDAANAALLATAVATHLSVLGNGLVVVANNDGGVSLWLRGFTSKVTDVNCGAIYAAVVAELRRQLAATYKSRRGGADMGRQTLAALETEARAVLRSLGAAAGAYVDWATLSEGHKELFEAYRGWLWGRGAEAVAELATAGDHSSTAAADETCRGGRRRLRSEGKVRKGREEEWGRGAVGGNNLAATTPARETPFVAPPREATRSAETPSPPPPQAGGGRAQRGTVRILLQSESDVVGVDPFFGAPTTYTFPRSLSNSGAASRRSSMGVSATTAPAAEGDWGWAEDAPSPPAAAAVGDDAAGDDNAFSINSLATPAAATVLRGINAEEAATATTPQLSAGGRFAPKAPSEQIIGAASVSTVGIAVAPKVRMNATGCLPPPTITTMATCGAATPLIAAGRIGARQSLVIGNSQRLSAAETTTTDSKAMSREHIWGMAASVPSSPREAQRRNITGGRAASPRAPPIAVMAEERRRRQLGSANKFGFDITSTITSGRHQ